MFAYRGRTALITGASWGIETAFSRALAERGMNLILVARSRDRLETLAADQAGKYSVLGEVVWANLSQAAAADEVRQGVARRGLTVDLLVNNAGFATHGHFENPVRRPPHPVDRARSASGIVNQNGCEKPTQN